MAYDENDFQEGAIVTAKGLKALFQKILPLNYRNNTLQNQISEIENKIKEKSMEINKTLLNYELQKKKLELSSKLSEMNKDYKTLNDPKAKDKAKVIEKYSKGDKAQNEETKENLNIIDVEKLDISELVAEINKEKELQKDLIAAATKSNKKLDGLYSEIQKLSDGKEQVKENTPEKEILSKQKFTLQRSDANYLLADFKNNGTEYGGTIKVSELKELIDNKFTDKDKAGTQFVKSVNRLDELVSQGYLKLQNNEYSITDKAIPEIAKFRTDVNFIDYDMKFYKDIKDTKLTVEKLIEKYSELDKNKGLNETEVNKNMGYNLSRLNKNISAGYILVEADKSLTITDNGMDAWNNRIIEIDQINRVDNFKFTGTIKDLSIFNTLEKSTVSFKEICSIISPNIKDQVFSHLIDLRAKGYLTIDNVVNLKEANFTISDKGKAYIDKNLDKSLSKKDLLQKEISDLKNANKKTIDSINKGKNIGKNIANEVMSK